MKKKFIFGFICLFACITGANAQSLFNHVAPNEILEMESIKPADQEGLNHFLTASLAQKFDPEMVNAYVDNCNSELTECELYVYNPSSQAAPESHVVKISYIEGNQNIKNLVTKYKNAIEATRSTDPGEQYIFYKLADLSLINYYYHLESEERNYDLNTAINYSPELKKMFENTNITYYLNTTAGSGDPLDSLSFFGTFALMYHGYIYDYIDYIGVKQVPVIYVPDNTADTDEAYIAAAKKRIDDYLGNDSVRIEVYQPRTVLESMGYDFNGLEDVTKMSENLYYITIGQIVRPFVFVKNSSKMIEPQFVNKDLSTNVEISSNASEIPLDTNISVKELQKEELELLKNLLNVDVAQTYDISLYSNASNRYITKLSEGNEFEVSFQIIEELKGKKLVAYYYNEDTQKVEAHEVTIDGNNAKFKTNHFSTYTIAEDQSEDALLEPIPPTYDGMNNYIVIGIIGLVGLGLSGFIYHKTKKID